MTGWGRPHLRVDREDAGTDDHTTRIVHAWMGTNWALVALGVIGGGLVVLVLR